jgi:hypothetical protein
LPPARADDTLRAQYARFADQRTPKEFLGRVTRAVWGAAERADLGDPSRLASVPESAVAERHLSVWLARPDEEAVLQHLGLTGSVPAPTEDAFFSTVQNANATKLDFYANLPAFVTGPVDFSGRVGDLQSFVSLYSGLDVVRAERDGRPIALEGGREFGRYVYSTFASVPRGGETRFDLSLQGRMPLDGGWYRVRLLPQAGVQPESVDVAIRVARGYVIDRTHGCRLLGARACIRSGPLAGAGAVEVHLRRGG